MSLNSTKSILIVVLSVLLFTEIVLRAQGIYKVYQEQIGNSFETDYAKVLPSWYFTWTPSSISTPKNKDFSYEYAINSWGFREKEFDLKTSDSIVRIVVTGDSFTEGVGAPYDSTWPRLLEKELLQYHIKAEVIDAARSGSDIFYDFVFYRDKLSALNPDIVIAALNLTDYQDYIFRGGMERFRKDGKTQYNSAPWYQFIYRYSHLFRAVMMRVNNYPFNGIFVSQDDYISGWKSTTSVMEDVFLKYKNEAKKNGSNFISVLHVTPCEIMNTGYFNDTNKQNLYDLDSLLKNNGVNSFNISDELQTEFGSMKPEQYTYKHDQHFKPNGYAAMAKIIAQKMLDSKILEEPIQQ
jgi:lysophospholipase L1-like esterase